MKLHFEPNLDYQLAAIESVCDLFRGQEICRTEFTVTREFGGGQAALAGLESDIGIDDRLRCRAMSTRKWAADFSSHAIRQIEDF